MDYKIILTIALLSTVRPQYQELELISQLNNFFIFDHNVFLLDSSTDFDRYILTKSIGLNSTTNDGYKDTPKSIYIFQVLENNITGLENLVEIKSKNTFLIIALGSSNFERNLQFLTQVKLIKRLNINMKIGMFFSDISSSDNVQQLFTWCWNNHIVHIFTAFYSNSEQIEGLAMERFNVYRFNGFGTDAINVTHLSYENYFPSKLFNLQQYPVRLPYANM